MSRQTHHLAQILRAIKHHDWEWLGSLHCAAHSMNMCASTLELFVALWSWNLPFRANEGRPFGRGRSSIRSRLSLWSVCLVVVGWLAMTCKTVCFFSCNLSQTKKGELNVSRSRSRLPVLLPTGHKTPQNCARYIDMEFGR